MALWKSDSGSVYESALHPPGRRLDLAVLIATAAAPGLLLVCLIPLPLVLPVLSVVAFAVAVIVALFAHYSEADRRAPGITPWDVAGVFALIWIGAGMLSEPKHVVQLFSHMTTAP